jgi:ATP/maltotriose-dependent transcriptional regulator MalT
MLDIERSGDPTEAAALTRWFESARGDRLPFIHPSLPSFVRLFLAAGDEPGAHAATEAAEREAGRDPLSRKQAVAHWCRGLLDTDPAAVLAAAGSLRDLQLPVLAGSAFEDAAVLLAAGCSNPDIARQLFISRRTVESHVSHILAKLQVASRREVRLAAEHVNNGLP